MGAERMKLIRYTGEIWAGSTVHPDLWNLLLQKDLLIEITGGAAPFQVILGVPHQAAPRANRIAEDWINPRNGKPGRPGDEMAGFFGLILFNALQEKGRSCKLVIAAHPTDHDPNKTPASPYWQSIFRQPLPALLLELHGAANHRRHALELSAGRNQVVKPLLYGRLLAYYINDQAALAVQVRPNVREALVYQNQHATRDRLQNPALETATLEFAGQLGLPALHLEMKSIYRRPDLTVPGEMRPRPAALHLAQALATTLERLSQANPVRINGADLGLSTTAFLTRPSLDYEASFLQAIQETDQQELEDNPDLCAWSPPEFRQIVAEYQNVIYAGLPAHPPEECLWLIDQGEFIGRVFFLHWLNGFRLETDGQVDYWIRPSRRRQGYGQLILRLALERFRQLGLQRILISCLASNLPSQKIIEANGGVFEREIELTDQQGQPARRKCFWISLKDSDQGKLG